VRAAIPTDFKAVFEADSLENIVVLEDKEKRVAGCKPKSQRSP